MAKGTNWLVIGAIGLGAYLLITSQKSSDSGGGGVSLLGGLQSGVKGVEAGIGGLATGIGDVGAGLGGIAKGAGEALQAGAGVIQAGAGVAAGAANIITNTAKGVSNVENKAASTIKTVGSFYGQLSQTPTAIKQAVNLVTTGHQVNVAQTALSNLNKPAVSSALSKVGNKTPSQLTQYLTAHRTATSAQVQAWLRS